MKNIELLTKELSTLIEAINHHPLYAQIRTLRDLRIFMEYHVFAVWDFMCLLKELQRRLVSTSAPWFPPKDAQSAHLINSILVEEEGDLTEDGQSYLCHFDLYLSAMKSIGADTQPIQNFLHLLKAGYTLPEAVTELALSNVVHAFISTTFSFFQWPTPALAATFVYGREAITSRMFQPLVHQLQNNLPINDQSALSTLIYYCRRHIELDHADHFPKAQKMLVNLMDNDEQDYSMIADAAAQALRARLGFLTGIQRMIQTILVAH